MVTTLIKDEDVGSVEVKFEKYLTKGDSFGVFINSTIYVIICYAIY